MRYLIWAPVIFAAFLLQERIRIFDTTPKLSFLLAYYAGIRYGPQRGILLGILIGGIEDSLTSSALGPNFLMKGLTSYFSSYTVSGGFFRWTPLLGIIAILFFSLIDSYCIFILRSFFESYSAQNPSILLTGLRQAILIAPAGMLLAPRNAD